jgi:hypothetical protein
LFLSHCIQTTPTAAATVNSTPQSYATTGNAAHVQPQQHTIPTSPIIQAQHGSSGRNQDVDRSSIKSVAAAAATAAAATATAVPQTEDSESDDGVQEDDSDSEQSDCSD